MFDALEVDRLLNNNDVIPVFIDIKLGDETEFRKIGVALLRVSNDK